MPLMLDSPSAVGPDVNNFLGARNVYPAFPGYTTGGLAQSASPYSTLTGGASAQYERPGGIASVPAGITGASAGATRGGLIGQPLTWWAAIVALFVALMWGAQKYSSEGEQFATIKLSIVNVFAIGLAAAIFIGLAKAVFGRFTVPGLSDFIVAL